MRRLLVLRPEPGASATVDKARRRGIEAIAVPLFEIEAVAWEAPDAGGFDALLLTSANAVRHGGEGLKALLGLPVFAVGDATADAAREGGFGVAAVGDGGVEELLASIGSDLRLLHLCGADRQAVDRRITAIIVYHSSPIPSPDLSEAAGSVALIHSPRAGRRLAELIGAKGGIAIAAISPAAAKAAGTGWEGVEAADRPSDDALLALAARLCNKPAPQ